VSNLFAADDKTVPLFEGMKAAVECIMLHFKPSASALRGKHFTPFKRRF